MAHSSAGKNHSVAGAFSGLVIAWGNSPANMLGSAVLLAAVSGYLARAEHVVATGPANAAQLHPPSQPASKAPIPSLRQERSTRRRGQHGTPSAPPGAPCASITFSMCPHSMGLLEQTAHYINFSGSDPARHLNIALAAATALQAVKPGCRTCRVPKVFVGDQHSEFL